MASQQRWVAAVTELLGTPVFEVVFLRRRKEGAVGYDVAGFAVFGAVVLLHEFGVIPGPSLLVYFAGALPMSFLIQRAYEAVFAARTPAGILMTSGTRWWPRPVGPPRGRLDPAVVSGPHGLLRTWDIAGVRHQTSLRQAERFQRMLAAASVGESAP